MTQRVTGAVATSAVTPGAYGQAAPMPDASPWFVYDVKHHGAKGDGVTIDTPAINRAIEAANKAGGGTVRLPAGTYACYSIHLKSNIALYLEHGATILAASVPEAGGTGYYDLSEPKAEWEPYQDYGHNHWHNSLLWGEGLENVAILG